MIPSEANAASPYHVASLTIRRTALVITHPFSATYHTSSDVGPIGGNYLRIPDEPALAHRGFLFGDERRSACATAKRSSTSRLRTAVHRKTISALFRSRCGGSAGDSAESPKLSGI